MEKKILFIGLLIITSFIIFFKKDLDMFSSKSDDDIDSLIRAKTSMGIIIKTGGKSTSYGPTIQEAPKNIKSTPSKLSNSVTTNYR